MSSNRIIVDKKIIDAYTERFVEKVKRLKGGDGLEEDTLMDPLIEVAPP